ncbi:MAG: L-seryl-tRNA(Sec) selenium transferase [bacterium]|nr:L-seryl-tRNA(Sec) selenium transferase [bacterium]
MEEKNNILRNIPQVEKLLQNEEIERFIPLIGHSITANIIRKEIESFREDILAGGNLSIEDLTASIVERCSLKKLERLQRVINGTGVIIHTNLGRSPISSQILKNLEENLTGYCNLEFHIPTKKRGKRGGMAEELLCNLTGAEDALIVNNNASSVFLILSEFARRKEVIVSRGELIQIGGGFRIPDIMKKSGARLIEVGTTNITELEDFEDAITERTAMIFSAHQSNYTIEGFARIPSLKELAALKNESIIFARDLGSGNLVTDKRTPQPFEATITTELAQGPDLICFSGDKLLGSCQAGIIVGRKDLIDRMRKHPLMRMIRVDKVTYYILQETLLKYDTGKYADIALWDTVFQDKKTVSKKIDRILRRVDHPDKKEYLTKIPTMSTFGGGTLPALEIESVGINVDIPSYKPAELYSRFLNLDIPIVGTVIDDRFCIDAMTILEEDIQIVADALEKLLHISRG